VRSPPEPFRVVLAQAWGSRVLCTCIGTTPALVISSREHLRSPDIARMCHRHANMHAGALSVLAEFTAHHARPVGKYCAQLGRQAGVAVTRVRVWCVLGACWVRAGTHKRIPAPCRPPGSAARLATGASHFFCTAFIILTISELLLKGYGFFSAPWMARSRGFEPSFPWTSRASVMLGRSRSGLMTSGRPV